MSSYASKNIRPQYRKVVIVGAGVSGIAMACMLRKRLGVEGSDFVILDKEPAPAGSECSGARKEERGRWACRPRGGNQAACTEQLG